VNKRNEIVHARPATTEWGEQRLYRWDAKRGVTPHFFTGEQLTEFADNAIKLARGFDGVRQQLKR
jgi:hypothetical protein